MKLTSSLIGQYLFNDFMGKLTTEDIIKKVLGGQSIPTGNTDNDRTLRAEIITKFYKIWGENNPARKMYNHNLKDYINIRQVSVTETARHAAKSYLSTLAVLQLDTILQLAKKVRIVNTKPHDKNQKPFEKIIKMEYELAGIGKVSLTVGIHRPNRDKVKDKIQYCITVINV